MSTYCEIPWIGVTLDSHGRPQACCEALGTEVSYVDDRGAPLNASTHTFEEIRNSPAFRQIRRELLAGEKPKACNRCWQDEGVGITSLRQNRGHGLLSVARAKAVTDSEGRIETAELPFVPELRLSNLCNLRCRMCGPEFSNAWDGTPAVELESPLFLKSMEAAWPNVRKIFFTGGEPLLQKGQYEALEFLVAQGLSHKISLSYTTNLTRLPDRILKLWENFESVHVGVSIEGIGTVQEYIRHPSRWKTIEKNILKLDAAAGTRRWSAIFQTTVNIYNVLYIDELVHWFIEARFQAFLNLELRRLSQPEYLNIQALPRPVKMQARAALGKAVSRIEKALPEERGDRARFLRQTAESIRGLAEYMDAEDRSHEWPAFVAFTRKLDRIRRQGIERALPELAQFMTGSRLPLKTTRRNLFAPTP